MNPDIFSPTGYASIAVWLCMPLLWIVQMLHRPRGWWCHVAVMLGVVAFVLAKINSDSHVGRIQVDRSEQIKEQLDRQELARQEAVKARENEVAQIRFAEDDGDDFLDQAGMDESDIRYLESFDGNSMPEWKREKKQRSEGGGDDSLETQIGATEEQAGVETERITQAEPAEPILMSDRDKLAADRLDAANLTIIRGLFWLGLIIVVIDYLKRANVYDEAYFPLPLPSSWVDSFTSREPVTDRPESPRRSLPGELRFFARRGESFVYLTDDPDAATGAAGTVYRLPFRRGPVAVLAVDDADERMDDDFIFETLWYGRHSFVVSSVARAEQILSRFLELMQERRSTRARSGQTVHVVWDVAQPISEEIRHRFTSLGRATGYSLLVCKDGAPEVRRSDVNLITGPVSVVT